MTFYHGQKCALYPVSTVFDLDTYFLCTKFCFKSCYAALGVEQPAHPMNCFVQMTTVVGNMLVAITCWQICARPTICQTDYGATVQRLSQGHPVHSMQRSPFCLNLMGQIRL